MEPTTAQEQLPAPEVNAPKREPENGDAAADQAQEPPSKKARLDDSADSNGQTADAPAPRMKGVAPIKPEFILDQQPTRGQRNPDDNADDAAEAAHHDGRADEQNGKKNKKKKTGQNTNRTFGRSEDAKGLCSSVNFRPEFSPAECTFGEKCRYEHDLRKYLKEHKREDLTTFNGVCPVWDINGKCFVGWKCRFVGSHSEERETADGRKELVLIEDEERKKKVQRLVPFAGEDGAVNVASMEDKIALARRKMDFPRAGPYSNWLENTSRTIERELHKRHRAAPVGAETKDTETKDAEKKDAETKDAEKKEEKEENRALYVEPPFMPSEKRRLYFGPETPALAPLTTQGNMPFRRLCVELGAQFTYSEMAMSLPLIQGNKSEWALMRAHESEMLPPTMLPGADIVQGYDNSKDMKFGAQIAANKPWQAFKATEALAKVTPNLRVIDLNCGCPIDLVFKDGAGSALLEHPSKLEKIIRGMNTVSDQIPITVKIRMGTKDNNPNALKLTERLLLGGYETSLLHHDGAAGAAAITLHGRSRQQRYTRQADWEYISECAALIKRLNEKTDAVTDTIREPDARTQPNGGKVYFLGNGDCYSHVDYDNHINNAGVDAVMLGRGPLIKPWLFEEIQAGQYLDKSATERLAMIEKFCKYGLEAWGSDEHGVGTTRRFLMEWLSFTRRYVPIGLLEHLPPYINDRPPAFRGRNELETLLASANYKDWLKISEMFLGPAHKDFKFEPKHKSNSYDEAEG
ncbi:tRNA dihydrouridine synthase [Aspergillus costaricaensis CBS 115574]|uniref:tRNA dihydrouridine synthase n=1 Tax=Aspergillus costaricaensis CBS 115574 TaxID=1448317 RepID=A0ACD1IAQ5_9EURO|nr:tRNA dihydrouridine synthase [Aspergillus costaricaensis CBS 115574]RAK87476.1 tRNA dihydrouridine synthase [Aspergillus costaricaensis CBS 115574]